MSDVLLRSARFHLRPLTTDDVTERYVSWLRDDKVSRFIEAAKNQNDAASLKAYVAEQKKREDVMFLGIFEPATGSHIGNIKFQRIDPDTGFAAVGILIGEKSWWGKGVAVEVLEACARWLQLHRSVHWIRLGVQSSNIAAMRAYHKAGFSVTETGHPDASGERVLTMVRDQRRIPRLALGTAQFGQPYGIANRTGMMSMEEAAAIVACARRAGVDTLDTAIAYGESERWLGEIGVREWRVISKLPQVPEGCDDVPGWLRTSVEGSLKRLGVDHLHGLLLHHTPDLWGPQRAVLCGAMESLKGEGLVGSIGVSVYGPDQLDALSKMTDFDLVQAPFNVLDRRLATSGWLGQLWDSGIRLHARSSLLQGLLLMSRNQLPEWFHRWNGLWDCWSDWLQHKNVSPLAACVGFVLAEPRVERVVVGVDSLQQFQQLLLAARQASATPPPALASEDLDLIDPSRWVTH